MTQVEFVEDCEIEVIGGLNEEIDEKCDCQFYIGDQAKLEILDEDELDANVISVQFSDGSVAFGLNRTWFKEIALGM